MTARLTLRTVVLAAVAAGAVLAPSAAAFADSTPKPATPRVEKTPSPVAEQPTARPADSGAGDRPAPAVKPRGGVAAGDRPAPAVKTRGDAGAGESAAPAVKPRGGVAAGERPAGGGDSTTALVGSAAGAMLLAGAGTIVLRRRSAAHRNG
ncbi:hypothetical protein AB0L80_11115 [Streptomyces sp. NPDC052069]|uniref:hypothetical protein n=1 Tax=Streptomyces sp. NPDC052069 TaxID=3154650 RepID=UPI003437FA16